MNPTLEGFCRRLMDEETTRRSGAAGRPVRELLRGFRASHLSRAEGPDGTGGVRRGVGGAPGGP